MYLAWRKSGHDPNEADARKREAGIAVITNQTNATMTALSIVVAGIAAVLAIGLDKQFPSASLVHLRYSAASALFAIILGVYTLGYISSPSVFHKFDVTKKISVQLAAFAQLNLLALAAFRLLLGLLNLSHRIGS